MGEFSYRAEGPGVVQSAFAVWVRLLWMIAALFLVCRTPRLEWPLKAALCALIPLAAVWLLREILFIETVSSSGDAIVFRPSLFGIPWDRPRGLRKSEVSRVGMIRIWIGPRNAKESARRAWSVTVHSNTAPAVTTAFPMSERDADALYSFLQKELGRS